MNSKWKKKKVWQFISQLYMESGFSHTQRNWFFAWHYIINNIGWCKSQIRWIFFNILNMTFQCSLCLDDAWNSNQHFPSRACICWMCHELFFNYHTALPAAQFIILTLKKSAMFYGFGQKWQPEGISCIMVISKTSFITANYKKSA